MATEIESLEIQIQSQATQATSGIDKLTASLSKLKTAITGTTDSANRSQNTTDKVATSNKKAATSYVNLYAKIKLISGALRGVTNFLSQCVYSSMEYTETVNMYAVSLGKFASEAKQYAEEVSEAMGIDPAQFLEYEGVFNTIIEGFGVASDKAYLMSQNLTQIGYDLASMYNISFDKAMLKVQSGISGELEPLRRLGYDLSVARLEQERLNLGIDKSVSSMTQAEKAQLRYYAIMTQVTVAQGDMARTINSPANQLRVFKAQLQQCARAIGNSFIPALNAILPYAIAVAKVIRYVAEQIAAFFGYELPEVDWSSTSSGVSDLSSGLGDVADSADGASKAVKELKNATLGIDELNVISENANSGSGGGGSGGASVSGGDLGIDLPTYDFLGNLTALTSDTIADDIKSKLAIITAVIAGFMIFLGTICLLTGNIPVGAALLVTGVIAELGVTGVALDSSTMSDELKKQLATVVEVVSLAALVIGFILAFTGHLGIGIALIAVGAIGLSSAIALEWEALGNEVGGRAKLIENMIAGFVLALGAILAFSGVGTTLGIALIGVGATALIKNANLKERWDKLSDKVKTAIQVVVADVALACFAIGALLAFSGIRIALGISMMAVAAAVEYKALSVDWDTMSEKTAAAIMAVSMIIGASAFAIGAVLAFSGVSLPTGIAMMAVGAVTLYGSVALLWNKLSDKTKSVISIITAIVGAALLVIGAILAFSGVGIPLGITLMAAGAAALIEVVVLNWDWIKEKVANVLQKIKDNAGTLGKLALGLILCASGVGLPLGIALIVSGVKDFVTGETLNWDALKNKISTSLDKVKNVWTNFKNWIKGEPAGEFKVNVQNNSNSWWSNVKNWWNNVTRGKTLEASVTTKIKSRTTGAVEYATGGIITPHYAQKIPAYANGTNDIHGSLFVAGEAGAELVGHIGGRSEVLNRFQLASVMHSSIVSGMSLYTNYWKAIAKDVVSCANGVINAITVSGAEINKTFEVNLPKSYEVNGTVTAGVYDTSKETYASTYDDSYDGMRQFYTEYIEPTLKQVASDTKRQADKSEKTVIQVNGKTLAETVARQQKANGYVFTK